MYAPDLFGFNSRTLGRVRHYIDNFNPMCIGFQFTHPGKGATRSRSLLG